MALIGPILDDRTYEQLRDELVKRIPVYAPEWTNHNESDPGIALLELFAYLGESLLFRFNQIPDTTKVAFLDLLGVKRRPAQPAHVLLCASTETATGIQVLRGTPAAAGAVRFLTDDEVFVWPLDSVGAGKVAVAEPTTPTKAEKERRDAALAHEKINAADAAFYETQQLPDDPTTADAVALDVSSTLDTSLWVALVRKPTTDLEALRGRTVFVGVAFDEDVPLPFALEDLDTAEAEQYRSSGLTSAPLPMLWQLWNPDDTFTTLSVLGDTTGGLVTTGVVKVELPKQLPVLDGTTSGGSDSPPPLADEKQQRLVVGWLRVSRPKGTNDSIRRIRWVGLNAVGADQCADAGPELLGVGTGNGGQRVTLAERPVLAGTAVLEVEEVDGWHEWQEVENFTASRTDDRHYTIDHTEGVVSFGTRRVPQIGERIRVRTYRTGGGLAGNVAAKAVTAFSGIGGVKVLNPLAATGGADAASLTEALDAIPDVVHRHDRVVVASDFSTVAEEVTGVARADTLPLLHPDTPSFEAAGVVSVVVFPEEDFLRPDAPTPDHELLRRVARELDRRRLVTSELYVVPPTYVAMVVSVGVKVRDGFQVDAVRRWVELILRQYLAPLPPYGPDGGGWPLGRTVRRAELEAVAVQVDGVEYIEDDLLLGVPQGSAVDQVGKVDLERWQVPQLVDITVVAGPPLPLGDTYEPPPPPKIPVPLPPEVC
jgi:predicted phage baseplate assembly protein